MKLITTTYLCAGSSAPVVVPRTNWHSYKSKAHNGAQEESI